MTNDPVLDALRAASKGLVYTSETDAPLEPFIWKGADPLTDDKVRELAGADDDETVEQTTLDKFFHTVPSEVLFPVFEARGGGERPSLLYSGDDQGANELAATLIRDVGFDPVYIGPLRMARYTEPFVMVIAKLAYEGDAGPELAYRFERYTR